MSHESEPFYPSASGDPHRQAEQTEASSSNLPSQDMLTHSEAVLTQQIQEQIANSASTLQYQTYAMKAQH